MAKRQTSESERLPENDGFLYRSVSRKLRNLIDGGTYKPGAQLPSAIELARDFGVSTITIRRAIRDLSLEGRLVGRQGLGVFVASKRKIVRVIGMDYEDTFRKAGLKLSIQVLQLTLVDVIDDGPIELEKSGMGYRLDKIILADDEPVVLDTTWFPNKFADILIPKIRDRLITPLIEAHAAFEHMDYEVEGSTATEEQAALLKVVPGFPVLAMQYTAVGRGGEALFVGRAISRADHFVYQFRHAAKGSSRPSSRKRKK
ncbi:GntR family transcriptional regulator [Bradyrhizobium sp. SSUT77]|uniref:GntR family transcriptional regulator n=1 Tax=Bradyrhizobium sp. SSUT77 TaxID=3040603 RepID=UPI0024497880|nr:GntR family transcriptional regulator [Bradyrhizobium sp. SSUT77]MDH2348892.1 GntR family transcriptional regulator [Bradyrhizobium sp. SSUT77]